MAERGSLEADLMREGARQATRMEAAAAAEAAEPQERPHLPRYALGAAEALESYPLEAVVPQAVWAELPHAELLAQVGAVRSDAELSSLLALLLSADAPPAAGAGSGFGAAAGAARGSAGVVELGALRRARDEVELAAGEPGAAARLAAEARALLYLRHLLSFLSLPRSIKPAHRRAGAEGGERERGGADGGEEGGRHPLALQAAIPERVWALLLRRFTEPTQDDSGRPSNRRTEPCADRLACHALALMLRLSRNALRVDAAAEALKLPKAKVTTCLRELGCTVGAACPPHAPAGTQAAGARYAELRLPLTFPAIKKKVQRAGR